MGFFRIARRTILFLLLAASVLGSLIFSTHAAAVDPFVFDVNDSADEPDLDPGDSLCKTAGNKCTLRAAVMQANVIPNVNSTINLPAGTYTLGLPIDPNKGSLKFTQVTGNPLITIAGAGEGLTTIDANSTDRVIYVHSGRRLNVSGVSLVNGNSAPSFGGAVYNAGTLNLTDVTIFNSTAPSSPNSRGGGIHNNFGATLSLMNVTLNKNTADSGGAIANTGSLSISHSLITHNIAGHFGGGIYSEEGSLDVDFCIFSFDNAGPGTGEGDGGGIYAAGGPINIAHSTLDSNSSSHAGGAVYLDSAVVKLDRSTVSRNTASLGGGLRLVGGGFFATNSTISQNQATGEGGGIYNSSAVARVYNSTIAFNQADADGNSAGGGISNLEGGEFQVHNSIVAGNFLVFDNLISDCAGTFGFYGGTGFEVPSIFHASQLKTARVFSTRSTPRMNWGR